MRSSWSSSRRWRRSSSRFAIDFVQLNADERRFAGPIDELSSYAFFGAPIHSVAAGTVVRLQDGLPEQTPGALPAGQTVETAGSAIGSERARCSGCSATRATTEAPHLHLHIMDGPSPLQSNGLPFVFTGVTGEGRVTDLDALVAGEVTLIDPWALDGAFRHRMPLGLQVVDFGP